MAGFYTNSTGIKPPKSMYRPRPPSPPPMSRPATGGSGATAGMGGYRGPSGMMGGMGGGMGGMSGGLPGGGGGMPTYQAPAARRIQPAQVKFDMPEAQAYEPQQYNDPNLDYMAGQGRGLMDPESEYYQRLSQGMSKQIGGQAQAAERAAALRSAYGGLGGGAGAELLATQADIGQSGLEAMGQAEANLRLQAPMAGAQMIESTFQPRLGYNQMTEGGRQFGAGMAENARQFGVGAGLQQQEMANQLAVAQAGLDQQTGMFNAQQQFERERMQWEAMMQQMALMYG